MTYSLAGRIQTRVLIYTVLGGIWTALVTPVLPTRLLLGASYEMAFTVLGLLVGLGGFWELVYHLLQQFRWDKDWPSIFSLLAGVPEGALLWLLLRTHSWFWDVPVTARAFWLLFISTWLVIWAVLSGPIRVLLVRRRWRGGRLFG
ncbi:MAG: hypothetical protein H0T54_00555 [Geodermatophilaceae bacterium]|nr:hypothetical protein [Geodermatophilaceae bacterium]